MRRTVAVVLVALGVFCIALAPLMRTLIADSLAKTPLDYYAEMVNTGQVDYFNVEDVEQVEDAEVEAHTTFRADVASSSDATVVWDQFTWVKDADSDYAISSTTRRAGHDRESGEGVTCCDPMIDESSVVQEGQIWKFPFFTEQRDYDFFESTLEETVPMEFDGEETVEGVETYRFVQTVEPTVIDEQTIPREVAGLDGDGDVTGDVEYSMTRTYWVEPVSGTPVDVSEDQHRVVVVDGEEVLTMLSGELRYTDETVQNSVANTEQARQYLPMLHSTLPVAALILGAGFIAVAVVLLVTGRRDDRDEQQA